VGPSPPKGTVFFSRKEIRSVRKTSDEKLVIVGQPTTHLVKAEPTQLRSGGDFATSSRFLPILPEGGEKEPPPWLELASSVYRRSQLCLKGEQAEKYANCCLYPARFTFFPEGTPLLSRATAIAILAVAILLILVPGGVLFFAISPEAVSQHLHPSQLSVACWAVWALVSLWAGLDSSRLWRVLGRPVDPLGPQALYGILLGALNIGAPCWL
jgi:hypothetical protein